MKLLRIILFFILCTVSQVYRGQEVLGGYIGLYKRGLYVVEANVKFAIRSSQLPVVKSDIMIDWGDGSSLDSIPFTSSLSGGSITIINYVGTHTFSPGIYSITTSDNYFAPNIVNLPNSSVQKLVLQRMINLQSFQTNGVTEPSLPYLSNFIFDTVPCPWHQYNSNLGFYSPAGDSLGYSIDPHPDIQGYVMPPAIADVVGNIIFTANASGAYNIRMRVDEFRHGTNVLMGYSFIDLYVSVCNIMPTTVIETKHMNNGIKIFPNPVRDKLTVNFSDIETDGLKLNILNSSGQIVHSIEQIEIKQELDLSSLADGIYLLKIEGNSGQKVYKIVKD
jgi:hypothetical protein